MTSDKPALLSGIGNLAVGGGAAGHIGTAWSYYMLSPNWATVLPAGSTPSGYHLTKVHKIAVLMSDGVYALTHDDMGVQTDVSGGNANNASSDDQAIAICDNMKKSGIEVFAVGFGIQNNQTAINTLQSCASDAMKYYDAADGTKLKAAFRDIALRVSSLRLVN